jgi:MFS family permease
VTATRDTRFEHVLDSAAMTRFQIGVVLLCALVAMLDGFDAQSIAFAAPEIATEWALPRSAFGLVFSIGVFGGLIGAVAGGSISDRIGRRPVLLCSVALFALRPSLPRSPCRCLGWLGYDSSLASAWGRHCPGWSRSPPSTHPRGCGQWPWH